MCTSWSAVPPVVNVTMTGSAEEFFRAQVLRDLHEIVKLLRKLAHTDAGAVGLVFEGTNMTFTVDTTGGTATWTWVDDHNDPVDAPLDGGSTPSGGPLEVVVVSDTPSVVAVGTGSPGSGTGQVVFPLTMGTQGTANLSVNPITNSDGSLATDAAGNAYSLPSPVPVTVGAGPAVGGTLTVEA